MNLLDKIMPDNDSKRKWVAVGITVLLSALVTILGIYWQGQYGFALFIITPFFMGVCSTLLYGYKKPITRNQAWRIGVLTLGIFTLILILCAIEGLICIMMAAPFGFILTTLGSLVGYSIQHKLPDKTTATILILICTIPSMSFVESALPPSLTSVVTSIEISADAETVWKNVIEFPELSKPEEFIFQTGIAYPINAKIEGSGVGAVRHCNFTTGSFTEPITVWNEPNLLRFSVTQQPAPMKELSFWNVDAPHLHDYFVSKQGQFKLTTLPNGNTLLEGTTWYYHNIKPAFYWQIWSEYIIHKIHQRVLKHIKKNAESKKQ